MRVYIIKAAKLTKLGLVREILLFSIVLYFAQGALFSQGTLVTQLALLLVLAISFYYLLKVVLLEKSNNLFMWGVFLLFSSNALGYLFTLNWSESIYISQMKSISLFTLPFFPFYYLAKKGKLHEKHLIRFFLLIFIVTVLNFNYAEQEILSARISDNENVVNNIGYQFTVLIPYVYLLRNRIISMLTILVIMFFIIQSAKRGALIVGTIGLIFFIYHQLKTVEPTKRVRSYLLSAIGTTILFISIYHYIQSNEYLLYRLGTLDQGGSGRDLIYITLLKAWYNSDSIVGYILGQGFVSTIKLSGGSLAHNDWIELLVNFGIVGIIIYMTVFVGLLISAFKNNNFKNYNQILLVIIFMWLATTLFSMFYTVASSVIMMILIAFVMGTKNKRSST